MNDLLQPLENPLVWSILAVLVIGFVAAWSFSQHRRQRKSPAVQAGARSAKQPLQNLDTVQAWPPTAARVLAPSILQAHRVLQLAFPEHIIFSQISLSRFLRVPTRNSYAEWMRRVGGLCVDLLVCNAASQVVAVVEIRQPHGCQNEKLTRRQQRMDRVLEAAGIPVHVWLEGQLPSPAAARNVILGSDITFTTRTGATLVDQTSPDSLADQLAANELDNDWYETAGAAANAAAPKQAAEKPSEHHVPTLTAMSEARFS
jgi:Protein of unknown function (DUF2726)